MNPFVKLRRRLIPPCSECRWLNELNGRCRNPRGLDLLERLSGESYPYIDTKRGRGTKYCNFEGRDDG